MERLLLTIPPRCAAPWSTEAGQMTKWHACELPPGHTGDHACTPECGATLAQAGAA